MQVIKYDPNMTLADVFDMAETQPVVVKRDGEPAVVIMPYELYEKLREFVGRDKFDRFIEEQYRALRQKQ